MAEETKEELIFNEDFIGRSGTLITSKVFQDDYLTELTGTSKYPIYNKMRKSDAQIKKILSAIINPIKSAKWFIDPATTDEKDLKVASFLDVILFEDIAFHQKLGEFLTNLVHGFSMFEVTHENKVDPKIGQYTGLKGIAFRNQETITEWEMDRATDKLIKIRQQQTGDLEIDAWIEAKNLLIFYNEQEGTSNGESLLRPLYGPYKRKLLIETLKMIGIERSAVPTPMLKIPSGVSAQSEEYKAAIRLLSGFTSAENSYITYPEGYELELFNATSFDPMKLEDSIKRENEKMAGAILASFLELGTGGNGGAYALGESLERFFAMGIESYASNIAQVINKELIPNLVRLNFGDTITDYPSLNFSGITNKAGKVLMETITGYTAAGVISADETLEDYVRKVHDLPKKDEGEMIDNQETQKELPGEESKKEEKTSQYPEKKEPVKEEVKKEEEKQLSEKILKLKASSQPKKLIEEYSKELEGIMKSNLTDISRKLNSDIVNRYKKLPDAKKLDAVSDLNTGGKAKFKRQMKGALTSLAVAAIDQAKVEAGVNKKFKLSEKPELAEIINSFITEGQTIKLAKTDLTGLPTHVRKLVALQADRIVERQVNNLEDSVVFTYGQEVPRTNDYAVIQKSLDDASGKYIGSGSVTTGSVNAASTVVNQSRTELFFEKDVLKDIYAFEFVNYDPKSDICQTLTGTVWAANDPDLNAYQPPLHHNCKSFISPILVSQKGKPEVSGTPVISESAAKSKNLKEMVEKYLNLSDTE